MPPEQAQEFARTIALNLLDRRDYTRAELARKLQARGVPDEHITPVLARFEDVGLLDDQRYAERYAAERQEFRSLSRSAVRRELLGKGVDAEVADEVLASTDDDTERETALQFARRKARPLAGLPRDKAYRRLAGALARKGFPPHLVNQCVTEVLGELEAEQFADEVGPVDHDIMDHDSTNPGVRSSGPRPGGEYPLN